MLAGIVLGTALLAGCGEPLPPVPLDISTHDSCAESVPYVVDASASEVELPAGRHVVVLRADDVHRARGIAAQWIDIRPEGT